MNVITTQNEIRWQIGRRLFAATAIVALLAALAVLGNYRSEKEPSWIGQPAVVGMLAWECRQAGGDSFYSYFDTDGAIVQVPLFAGPAESLRSSITTPTSSWGDFSSELFYLPL